MSAAPASLLALQAEAAATLVRAQALLSAVLEVFAHELTRPGGMSTAHAHAALAANLVEKAEHSCRHLGALLRR